MLQGGASGGPGGGGAAKSGSDPRKVQIPKVKMARADDIGQVVQLLEHLSKNGTEQ